jgi:hypothetical protein
MTTSTPNTSTQTSSTSTIPIPSYDFYYINYGDIIAITGIKEGITNIKIPDFIDGLPVTIIENDAFKNSSLNSIILGKNINEIGSGAFSNCPQLTSVTFEGEYPNIEGNAFDYSNNPALKLNHYNYKSWEGIKYVQTQVDRKLNPIKVICYGDSRGCVNTSTFTPAVTRDIPIINLGNSPTTTSTTTTTRQYKPILNNAPGDESDTRTYQVQEQTRGVFVFEEPTYNYNFTYINNKTSITITGPKEGALNINIPDYIEDLPVTRIEDYAFEKSLINSIILSKTINNIGEFAFIFCNELESIIIPESVTAIGRFAFYGCTKLKSIIFEGSYPSIGIEAFNYTDNQVILYNNSWTQANINTFKLLSTNKTINFMDIINIPTTTSTKIITTPTTTTSTKSITTPTTSTTKPTTTSTTKPTTTSTTKPITTTTKPLPTATPLNFFIINNNVINRIYKHAPKDIIIPLQANGIKLTELREGSFTSFQATSISFERNKDGTSNITSIGKNAFAGNFTFTAITIPSSVTIIKEEAFAYCNNLTSITFEGPLPSIAPNVFADYNNVNLTHNNLRKMVIYHNKSWTQANINTIKQLSRNQITNFIIKSSRSTISTPLENFIINNNVIMEYYDSGPKDVIIPLDKNDINLTVIGPNAFTAKNIFSLSFENKEYGSSNITSIGARAFSTCIYLNTITIPKSIRYIEDEAFFNCESLTSITFEGPLPLIAPNAFKYSLKPNSELNFTHDSSWTQANVDTFKTLSKLVPAPPTKRTTSTALEFYKTDNHIITKYDGWDYTEFHPKFIAPKDVIIPVEKGGINLTVIGPSSFYGTDMTSLSFELNEFGESNIKIIEQEAFKINIYLRAITIPKSVKAIKENAFLDCQSLTRIIFEGPLPSIAPNAFKNSIYKDVNYVGYSHPTSWSQADIDTLKRLLLTK